jgi:hypothetical protein
VLRIDDYAFPAPLRISLDAACYPTHRTDSPVRARPQSRGDVLCPYRPAPLRRRLGVGPAGLGSIAAGCDAPGGIFRKAAAPTETVIIRAK